MKFQSLFIHLVIVWLTVISGVESIQGQDTLLGRLKALGRETNEWDSKTREGFRDEIGTARIVLAYATDEGEEPTEVRSAVKLPNSFDIVESERRSKGIDYTQTRVTKEIQLNVEEDIVAIADAMNQLEEERRVERALTAWYYVRVDAAIPALAAHNGRPLDKEFVNFARALGFLKVSSEPKRASVEVVGWGEWNPTDTEGYLPPGSATVIVRLKGYHPERKHIEIKARSAHELPFQLEPIGR